MHVRRIAARTTWPLRRAVLRPDLPSDALALRPLDEDPRSAHFGAFEQERLVAVASALPEPDPAWIAGAWRIRGVATEPAARGRGAGRLVVEACLAHARERGAPGVWLHGRVGSLAFYRALGFDAHGAPFDTPPSGLHLVMRRTW